LSRRQTDPQIVEILGRNWLVNTLLDAGIEVARPERDKGIDLIAYASDAEVFRVVPIQVKAASDRAFSVDQKYSRFANLLIVYIWNLQAEAETEAYAMTYQEVAEVVRQVGWGWNGQGRYSTSNPSKYLTGLLQPFRMTPAKWQERIRGS
jgi:hypothetical protein